MFAQDSIWTSLQLPIIALSPMDGVTDVPFRTITKKYGHPDLIFTEFSSAEGLGHGASELLKEFRYTPDHHPIIGQIYGTTPEFFRQSAILLCELGFDGVDINMGCPAKNVAHSGAGAALIKTPQLAQKIIKATQQGVAEWQNGATLADCPDFTAKILSQVQNQQQQLKLLSTTNNQLAQRRLVPISIKTRIGFDTEIVGAWIPTLLEMKPAAISLHGRTLRQLYTGRSDWEAIGKAADLVKQSGLGTKILGNGDIDSYQTAHQKIAEFNLDGVLIGRASFGNPWVFLETVPEILPTTKARVALEHAQLFELTYQSDSKFSFLPMRKHLSWYIHGFPQAKEIRIQLVQTHSSQEVKAIFQKFGLL
ncbi:MAG TPA: hypothetical protein DEP87_02500 [Candidatus Pacebacteria bacterium]|nr:hypothetical protein [Candidatus Paceibacterota bacterium]